jgi:hypothetical protein
MIRTISIVLLSAGLAASAENSNAQTVKARSGIALQSTGCDASLWNHVYNPKRLQRVKACLTVTGVITESSADDDGDQHFLLKLDPGQDNLVNKRNRKKKGGDIVLEIVCANPTKMKKPKAACAGYTNPIPIPAVGAHVRATGTYVIDSHNGWAEIHPVSRFQTL